MFDLSLTIKENVTQKEIANFKILSEDFEDVVRYTYERFLYKTIADLKLLMDLNNEKLLGEVFFTAVFNDLSKRSEPHEEINLYIDDISEIIIIIESIFLTILSNIRKAIAFPQEEDLKKFAPTDTSYELEYHDFADASMEFILYEYNQIVYNRNYEEIAAKINSYVESKDLNEYLSLIESSGLDWDKFYKEINKNS